MLSHPSLSAPTLGLLDATDGNDLVCIEALGFDVSVGLGQILEIAVAELLTAVSELTFLSSGVLTATETLTIDGLVSAQPTYALRERYVSQANSSAQATVSLLMADVLAALGRVRFVLSLSAGEQANLTDVTSLDARRVAALREALTVVAVPSAQVALQTPLDGSIALNDSITQLLSLVLAETLALEDADTLAVQRVARALDQVRLAQTAAARVELTTALEEALAASDALALVAALLADEDSLALGDTTVPAIRRVVALAEALRLGAVPAVQTTQSVGASESLTVLDRLRALFAALAEDSAGLADETAAATVRLALSREQLRVVGSAQAALTLGAQLLDGLSLEALAALFNQLSADDALVLSDTLTAAALLRALAPEVLELSETAAPGFVFVGQAAESLAVTDSLAAQLQAWLALDEGIAFIGQLPIGVDDNEDYQAWVLNTDSLGVTQYTNFPFDGLTSHGGRSFGLTATGLYELTGDDDDGAPIEALLRTGLTDFGTSYRKALPRAYLYLAQDGGVYLRVTTEWAGKRRQVWYTVTGRPSADAALRRVKLSRGLRGTSWQFEIANIDGGALDLRGAEVVPMVLSKRW